MTPYELSVQNAIEAAARTTLGERKAPKWLRGALLRLEDHIPTRYPVSVLAVLGVLLQSDPASWRTPLAVKLLLQRGWDKETSLLLWRNFRQAFPADQCSESLRLMSRNQLRDLYGVTFGDMFADTIADPDSQPILQRLIFGLDLTQYVYRPCTVIVAKVDIDPALFDIKGDYNDDMAAEKLDLSRATINIVDSAGLITNEFKSLTVSEAFNLYRTATGIEPDFLESINPHENDYEALIGRVREPAYFAGLPEE